MARPLRIEFSGALYHVTSRGDRREAIFEDDEDRNLFLSVLAEVVDRFNWMCHAYSLMTNHYHLVIETPDGNLSKGMRQLNGFFTQATNRRHNRSGHLFQGRFKGILVDKDSYLLELTRYVVLNPVRAGIVKHPGKYAWSSYQAMMGKVSSPKWLETDGLLSLFSKQRSAARRKYSEFVQEGIGRNELWSNLRQQIYLGDEKFVNRMQEKLEVAGDELSIPRAQRRAPPPSIEAIVSNHSNRNEAIYAIYSTGAYSYREIAEYFDIHLATVGRIVRRMQQCEN
jgi:putative transposase